MDSPKSSLSAGAIVRAILLDIPLVRERGVKVFPVFQPSEKAILPYIDYRRASLVPNPVKDTVRTPDTIELVLNCYTAGYAEGIELAEAVRATLDNRRGTADGLTMRSCYLSDSTEDYQADAYIQELTFTIKI